MIDELVGQLPNIMMYFVTGYLFISVFNFTTYKKKDTGDNNIRIIGCVVASFVIKAMLDCVLYLYKTTLSESAYAIILCMTSILLGYMVGIIVKCRWFQSVVEFLGIQRSLNSNIWSDVICDDRPTWISTYPKDSDGCYYRGNLKAVEENKREPIFALRYYQVYDKDHKLISEEKEREDVIMVRFEDCSMVEIVYGEETKSPSKIFKRLANKFHKHSNSEAENAQDTNS